LFVLSAGVAECRCRLRITTVADVVVLIHSFFTELLID
jgi:hypothetical protein